MPVLFKNIDVLTPDTDRRMVVHRSWQVAVLDGFISYAGPDLELARMTLGKNANPDVIDGKDRLLLPCFANTHNHMAMTLLRNQADDRNLHDWLFDNIFPREERLTADIVSAGSALAIAEMIRSGTGASADMYFFPEAVVELSEQSGFRINLACDVKRKSATGKTEIDAAAVDRMLSWSQSSELLRTSLLIHSIYLYEPYVYPLLAQLAMDTDVMVQLHLSETERENSECYARYGCSPTAQMAEFGFFRTPTIAAHCVYLDDADRKLLAQYRVTTAHCPASNLKLGSGFADIYAMHKAGLPVTIGTDGAASNNTLDLYRDLRLASFLVKGMHRDASIMPAGQILHMATRTGMQALGFTQSGQVIAGASADLQVIRTDSLEWLPPADPDATLIYSAAAAQVESVLVAGRWLMRNRELMTLDEERIRAEAARAAKMLNC